MKKLISIFFLFTFFLQSWAFKVVSVSTMIKPFIEELKKNDLTQGFNESLSNSLKNYFEQLNNLIFSEINRSAIGSDHISKEDLSKKITIVNSFESQWKDYINKLSKNTQKSLGDLFREYKATQKQMASDLKTLYSTFPSGLISNKSSYNYRIPFEKIFEKLKEDYKKYFPKYDKKQTELFLNAASQDLFFGKNDKIIINRLEEAIKKNLNLDSEDISKWILIDLTKFDSRLSADNKFKNQKARDNWKKTLIFIENFVDQSGSEQLPAEIKNMYELDNYLLKNISENFSENKIKNMDADDIFKNLQNILEKTLENRAKISKVWTLKKDTSEAKELLMKLYHIYTMIFLKLYSDVLNSITTTEMPHENGGISKKQILEDKVKYLLKIIKHVQF